MFRAQSDLRPVFGSVECPKEIWHIEMRIYAALAVLMIMLVNGFFCQQNIGPLLSSEVRPSRRLPW
jgi:hypothetical protein